MIQKVPGKESKVIELRHKIKVLAVKLKKKVFQSL